MKKSFLLEASVMIPLARQDEVMADIRKLETFCGFTHRKFSNELRSEIIKIMFSRELIGDFSLHQEYEELGDLELRLSNWLESKYRICVLSIKTQSMDYG